MTFLMREEISEGFPNDLKEHLAVISRCLLCAKENGKAIKGKYRGREHKV